MPVETASRNDKRTAMEIWFEPVETSDIPTPETVRVPIEREDGIPTTDYEAIAEAAEEVGGQAFVRTGMKSANFVQGQCIAEPTKEQAKETVVELLSGMGMMRIPLGKYVYVREWLDLEWDKYADRDLHPEVRFFIRDGEVVCWHLRTDFPEDSPHPPEVATQYFDPDNNSYPGVTETVHEYAEQAAEIFPNDTWYSVDFVLTADYNWYLTDAAIDALQFIEDDDKGWSNVSDHPGDCEHDLETMLENGKIDEEELTKPQNKQ